MTQISFIGLGNMGFPMAQNLIKAGHTVTGFDIDNASTDNSLEIARQLSAEDDRVQVVTHPRNLGHIASFNEGIDWAGSE